GAEPGRERGGTAARGEREAGEDDRAGDEPEVLRARRRAGECPRGDGVRSRARAREAHRVPGCEHRVEGQRELDEARRRLPRDDALENEECGSEGTREQVARAELARESEDRGRSKAREDR